MWPMRLAILESILHKITCLWLGLVGLSFVYKIIKGEVRKGKGRGKSFFFVFACFVLFVCFFVRFFLFDIETKRSDGKSFPSKTIDLLLAGLKRYMVAELKEKDPSVQPANFLSESDHRFAGLRGT